MGKRKARNRQNKSNRIDSRKRIVIATEGSQTEPKYFDALRQEHRDCNVRVLRKGTKSALMSVLNRLDKERKPRSGNSEFWAVIDHDRRPKEELGAFARRAKSSKYFVADSDPCFELWLILHFKAIDKISGLTGSAEASGCRPVESTLRQYDHSFSKSQYNAAMYISRIEHAIPNAKANEAQREVSGSSVGTRVYKLIESIRGSYS